MDGDDIKPSRIWCLKGNERERKIYWAYSYGTVSPRSEVNDERMM
jgi:hypothetical protein